MSRVEKKVNGGIHLPPFVFICNRYKFYNFPSIFCFVCPWTRAFPPNSRASFHHRNRDISLRLSKILQARQISFRKFCICTVKKAFFLPPAFYYTLDGIYLQPFSRYKTAFPCKKLWKNPFTSNPTFSKEPTIASGVAI